MWVCSQGSCTRLYYCSVLYEAVTELQQSCMSHLQFFHRPLNFVWSCINPTKKKCGKLYRTPNYFQGENISIEPVQHHTKRALQVVHKALCYFFFFRKAVLDNLATTAFIEDYDLGFYWISVSIQSSGCYPCIPKWCLALLKSPGSKMEMLDFQKACLFAQQSDFCTFYRLGLKGVCHQF